MTDLIVMLIVSGVFAWLCTGWVCQQAEKLHLVQAPNHRSSHVCPTPQGGGLGIVLSGVGSGVLLAWENGGIFRSVIDLSLLVAAVGLYDDMKGLSPTIRFAVQLLACIALPLTFGPAPILELPGGGCWLDCPCFLSYVFLGSGGSICSTSWTGLMA
jgi:Fuc2NAc and GlcNAc transferase